MKLVRISCLLLVALVALSPLGAVLAQAEVLSLAPRDGRYNTEIVAGKDRFVDLELKNLSAAPAKNIALSADKPKGWTVYFEPEKLASLEGYGTKRIDATIAVPAEADVGDYMVAFKASADQAPTVKIEIRVTVNKPIVEPKLEMRALYPTLTAIAGEELVFEVEFLYTAAKLTDEPIVLNLLTKVPPKWEVTMTPPYEKEKKLSAITLKPGFTFGDKIRVAVRPPFLPLPDPGEYKITLTGDSGKLKNTIELKAAITARYTLALLPADERYNTKAAAGKDNFFSIEVGNLGTAPIDKINFSSTKPSGWTIEFKPDKVDSLAALDTKAIDVNIKPPPETIAGDYSITLQASGTQATARELQIRVTVETPTLWGWVGVGIIFIVVVGLVYTFMRFSRR